MANQVRIRYLIYNRNTGEYLGCHWMRRVDIGWNANLLYVPF